MADELADKGCTSDEETVFPGQQKPEYGSLLDRVRMSMQTLLDYEKIRSLLPRDGAPNKALLKSITALKNILAAKLCSTIVVREALLCPDASVIQRVIAKCNDPTIKCWMRTMSGTYLFNSYLYIINKVKLPICIFCDSGDRETISHFLKVCPNMLEQQSTTRCGKPCSSCSKDMLQQTGQHLQKKLSSL